MASTTAEEELWLSGQHPALLGNAEAMSTLRSTSPTRSISPTSSNSSSPRFRAIDSDPPTSTIPPFINHSNRSSQSGASNTGPKGVLADWKASQPGGSVTSHTGPKGVLADWKSKSNQVSPRGIFENLKTSPSGIRIINLDELNLNLNELGLINDDDDFELRRELQDENKSEEEKAIDSYRRKRMFEMSGSGNIERNGSSQRKVFGHLREIGIDQFLSAIEDEHPDVAVVIHIYEPVSTFLRL